MSISKLRLSRRILTLAVAGFAVLSLSACSRDAADEERPGPLSLVPSSAPDVPATRLMYELLEQGAGALEARVARLVRDDDDRFVPVFIELLRAGQLGLLPSSDRETRSQGEPAAVLEALTGKHFGDDWERWVEWYGNTELRPPPGFTGWKGRLLSAIDPGFEAFLQDDLPSRIRVEEIQWGGVNVDGIPALDNPKMVEPDAAGYLTPGEPVIGLSIKGEARAYPLRIMDWHEMSNDVIGGVPVSISYCTLCGSAVAYDGRGTGDDIYTFGSSGLLYRSNKLMYDRDTRTLWNQFTGEPVLGELADRDIDLGRFPLVISSWEDWTAQHPGTLVLDPDTGYERPYTLGAAYGDYFESPDTLFPVAQRRRLLPAKARIYGLSFRGRARAYPLHLLARRKITNDTIGGRNVVVVATRGVIDVDARNRPGDAGDAFYESGGEVRSYHRGGLRFRSTGKPDLLIDERGHTWRVTERALVGTRGRELSRVTGQLAYWFAWFAFFPLTDVYEEIG